MGVVQFHLGNYEQSIAAIQNNLERAGPQPPSQIFYLAASMVGLGQVENAKKLLEEKDADQHGTLWQSWVYNNFADKREFDRLMSKLEPLGMEVSPNLGIN